MEVTILSEIFKILNILSEMQKINIKCHKRLTWDNKLLDQVNNYNCVKIQSLKFWVTSRAHAKSQFKIVFFFYLISKDFAAYFTTNFLLNIDKKYLPYQ